MTVTFVLEPDATEVVQYSPTKPARTSDSIGEVVDDDDDDNGYIVIAGQTKTQAQAQAQASHEVQPKALFAADEEPKSEDTTADVGASANKGAAPMAAPTQSVTLRVVRPEGQGLFPHSSLTQDTCLNGAALQAQPAQ